MATVRKIYFAFGMIAVSNPFNGARHVQHYTPCMHIKNMVTLQTFAVTYVPGSCQFVALREPHFWKQPRQESLVHEIKRAFLLGWILLAMQLQQVSLVVDGLTRAPAATCDMRKLAVAFCSLLLYTRTTCTCLTGKFFTKVT